VRYVEHHLFEHGSAQGIRLVVESNGVRHLLTGEGNGPIDAAVNAVKALGATVQVRSYEERSLGASSHGGDAKACAFIELGDPATREETYGVGIDANIITASIKALVSGLDRLRSFTAMPMATKAA
jgi:2-isopropylmalate synthase